MTEVSAPYNFVPLNEQIYYPSWGPLISHDIPFENGLSGSFEIDIEAKSPIFIRGKEEPNSLNAGFKQYQFPKINERYYIPGSSIKGEIRSVLEILSFGKLQEFNDLKYSQRDFQNEDIYKKSLFSGVLGGWLSRTTNGYKIRYCKASKPGRISHDNLGKAFLKRYSDDFRGNDKSAKDKYIQKRKYDAATNLVNFSEIEFNHLRDDASRSFYEISPGGSKIGTLIFTGQSSSAANPNGKKNEFIFWPTDSEEDFPDQIDINNVSEPDPIIKNFLFAYYDHESKSQSIDWKMWQNHLKHGLEIPVFITVQNDSIAHIGLSMLYKLPYDKSIGEIIGENQKDYFENISDLPECIFGNIKNEKLKGRVQIGHAFNTNNASQEPQLTMTLGSPKPTFYPFYIKQNFKEIDSAEIDGEFQTFNNGKIAGRKRYPIRETTFSRDFYPDPVPKKTTTTIFPLAEGVKFKCVVNFHNLLPFEVGALLSATTFHNQKSTFHSLGMGKAQGLGKVLLTVDNFKISNNIKNLSESKENYIGFFESKMVEKINNWLYSEQLTELIAMATPVSDDKRMLAYMTLLVGGGNNVNDYAEIKRKPKKGLQRYTKFMNIPIMLNSMAQFHDREDSSEEVFEKYFKHCQKKEKLRLQLTDLKNEIKPLKLSLEQATAEIQNHEKSIQLAFENSKNLPNIIFADIILHETETCAVIQSLAPKKASLMLDNELVNCQLVIPMEYSNKKLKIGDLINVIITQISTKNKTITMVKITD